jgi:hypothetical protein
MARKQRRSSRPAIIVLSAIGGGIVGFLAGFLVVVLLAPRMSAASQDAMGAALAVIFLVTPACAIGSGVVAAQLTRED